MKGWPLRTRNAHPFARRVAITTLYGATRDIVRPVIDEARLLGNLRKGMLEFCVLALLQTEPTYGLDLARRLQSDGLVASYAITAAAGGEAVATFESAWQLLRDAVDRTLRRER